MAQLEVGPVVPIHSETIKNENSMFYDQAAGFDGTTSPQTFLHNSLLQWTFCLGGYFRKYMRET